MLESDSGKIVLLNGSTIHKDTLMARSLDACLVNDLQYNVSKPQCIVWQIYKPQLNCLFTSQRLRPVKLV